MPSAVSSPFFSRAITAFIVFLLSSISLASAIASSRDAPDSRIPPEPPLGLTDVGKSFEWTSRQLEKAEATTLTLSAVAEVERCLRETLQYMDRVVAAETGQHPYQWVTIGRKRVSQNRWDSDDFQLSVPVLHAMTIRFDAKGGDIYLRDMTVELLSGAKTIYSLDRWILSDLPKRDVFYLPQAEDIRKIILTMRKKWQEPARMIVDVGISAKPEYARAIKALCEKSLSHLQQGNLSVSRSALHAAQERLREYQNDTIQAR